MDDVQKSTLLLEIRILAAMPATEKPHWDLVKFIFKEY